MSRIPGRLNSRKKDKGSDSSGKSSPARAKLRVLEIRASGGGAAELLDYASINFFQKIGLIGIKQDPARKNWNIAFPPRDTAVFFVEHDAHEGRMGGVFHLIKEVSGVRSEVEFGQIVFISPNLSKNYPNSFEIFGGGNALKTWEIICTKKLDAVPAKPLTPPVQVVPKPSPPPVVLPSPKVVAPPVALPVLAKTVAPASVPVKPPVMVVAQPSVAAPSPNLGVVSSNGLVVVKVKVAEVQRFNGQPREEFDQNEIAELAESLVQDKQQSMITVTPLEGVPGKKWELVDGERRFRAALLSKTEYLDAIVKVYKTKGDQFWASFIANWNRKGHTPIETSRAIAKAIADGKSVDQIVIATGRSDCWVYQHLQLQKLAFDLQELMKESVPKKQRLRLGAANTLARVPSQADQISIWKTASREATPAMVKLKVEELCAPILAKLPQKGRKRKPSDNAGRMLRIIRTGEADVTFLKGLKDEDFEALVNHKTFGSQADNLSARVLKIIEQMQQFVQKIKTA